MPHRCLVRAADRGARAVAAGLILTVAIASVDAAAEAALARPPIETSGFVVPQTTRMLANERSTGRLHVLELHRLTDDMLARRHPDPRDANGPFCKLLQSFDAGLSPAALQQALVAEVPELAATFGLTVDGAPVPITRAVAGADRTGTRYSLRDANGVASALELYAFSAASGGEVRTLGVIVRDDAADTRERAGLARLLGELRYRPIAPGDQVRTIVGGVPVGLPAQHRITETNTRAVGDGTLTEHTIVTGSARVNLRIVSIGDVAAATRYAAGLESSYADFVRTRASDEDATILWSGRSFALGTGGLIPVGVAVSRTPGGDPVRLVWGTRVEGGTAIGFSVTAPADRPAAADRVVRGLLEASDPDAAAPRPATVVRADDLVWAVPETMNVMRGPGPPDAKVVYAAVSAPAGVDAWFEESVGDHRLLVRRVVLGMTGERPLDASDEAQIESDAEALARAAADLRDRVLAAGRRRGIPVHLVPDAALGADSAPSISVETVDTGDGNAPVELRSAVVARLPGGGRVILQVVTPRETLGLAETILVAMATRGLVAEPTGETLDLGFGRVRVDTDRDLIALTPRMTSAGPAVSVVIDGPDERLTIFPADMGDGTLARDGHEGLARPALGLDAETPLEASTLAGHPALFVRGTPFDRGGRRFARTSAAILVDEALIVASAIVAEDAGPGPPRGLGRFEASPAPDPAPDSEAAPSPDPGEEPPA